MSRAGGTFVPLVCNRAAAIMGTWFANTPAALVATRATLTGEHLAAYVGS